MKCIKRQGKKTENIWQHQVSTAQMTERLSRQFSKIGRAYEGERENKEHGRWQKRGTN